MEGEDEEDKAAATLRAAVDAVAAEKRPAERLAAATALLALVQGEQVRIRGEQRRWALRAVQENWNRAVSASKVGSDDELRVVLEETAHAAGDVADRAFDDFRPGPDDLTAVRASLRHTAGAVWLLAYLALRTGALRHSCTLRPSAKDLRTSSDRLRFAVRPRARQR